VAQIYKASSRFQVEIIIEDSG